MNTFMKAMLACMPASALAETEIIELKATNVQGSEFTIDSEDALEFHWTGPGKVPFQDLKNLEVKESELIPAPYSVTKLETECQDVIETTPVPDQRLALYVVNGGSKTWNNVEHSEFDGVFTDMRVFGHNDWAYGHNRLWGTNSGIEINYSIPFAEIREHYPDARFVLDSAYFAAWNQSDLIIETTVNGHVVHDSVVVKGENHGRTYLQADLTDILAQSENGNIVLRYEAGWGPLFLHYFQIVANNLSETTTEEMCTWKWLVQPTELFSNSANSDNKSDTYGTYDIQFTGPNAHDYHSSITVLYD